MRRSVRFAVIAVAFGLLFAALGWWYYGPVTWSYPQWKSQVRLRVWRILGDPLDHEARRIAGPDAVNCGTSNGREDDTARVTGCISDAIGHHRGFRARFSYFAASSYGAEGLAGAPNGPVYELVLRLSPVFAGEEVSLIRRRCPEPMRVAMREDSPIPGCAPFATSISDYQVLRDDGAPNRASLGY
ncbi:MAG TPA: hypothetical protein VKW78_14965 [Terriglobales bacterium]|nr:hypothetical protein [Terriglobales bacterium]